MTGTGNCKVSNSQFEDGTITWEKSGNFIDTPGLDSNNIDWSSIHSKIKGYGDSFNIILVLDANMARANTFVDKFQKILGEFEDPRFYIVWTKAEPLEEKRTEWARKFTGKLLGQFYHADPNHRPDLSGCRAVRLKPTTLHTVALVPSQKKKPQPIKKIKALPPSKPIDPIVSTLSGLLTCLGNKKDRKEPTEPLSISIPAINSIYELVVRTNNPEVQRMRLVGDKILGFIVCLIVLEAKLLPEELSEFIKPLVRNEGGFMVDFIRRYFPHLRFDNEHQIADFFEALLAYALYGDREKRVALSNVFYHMLLELGRAVMREAERNNIARG
jgi:hypothetical protein